MLRRKMWREIRSHFGQFLSVFLLAALAVSMYATFEGNVVAFRRARSAFHEACNLSDLWIYSEDFEEEQLEAVRALDFVEAAQLRMSVTGTAPDQGGAQADLYFMMESLVNQPYIMEGADFDLSDKEGVWLAWTFADAWGLQVGDEITLAHNGVSFTKTIRGLIAAPEYEYSKAENDADTNFKNIAYAYMAYDAFPVRAYVEHLIDTGKISVKEIEENSDLLDAAKERLAALGLTLADLDKDTLRARVSQVSEEKLFQLLPYTQMLVRTSDGGALQHEDAIAQALDGDYAVMVDSSAVIGLERVEGELQQHEAFSVVFTLLFLGIALLVILTTMSRMVEAQRTQIGTMNAIGVGRGKILWHYISFSTVVALAGALLGFFVGTYLLAPIMVDLFGKWYIVPGLHADYDWTFILAAVLVVAACACGAWLSCRRLLRIHPAEALRPAAPKTAKRCLFERLPFWDKLSFNTRYNLRDISRSKLRSFMGVVGTACGMMMVIIGFGCGTMVDKVYDWSFDKIQNFDYELTLSEEWKAADFDALNQELDGELVMFQAIEVAAKPHATGTDKSTQTLTVLEGKGLYNLTDPELNVTEIPAGTVAITRRLAKDMGLTVGDTVYWHLYDKNDWYASTVGVISRSPETSGLGILRQDLEALDVEFQPNMLVTDTDPEPYREDGRVASIFTLEDMFRVYREAMEILDLMVYLMLGFSLVLVVAVLYNSGVLSFSERQRELATLRVMGFSTGRLRRLLSQQNLWLAIVGVLIGAPLGRPAVEAMANSNGANFDYYIYVPWYTYVISGLFVLLVSAAVSLLFNGKLKKIDMVATLKSE